MANILNLSGLTVLEVKETATEINVSAVSATYSRMCPLCAIDIRRPYREAVHAALPNATIVVDKYHVARMGNESLERVRRGLNVELPGKVRIGLKHDRNQVGRMSRRLLPALSAGCLAFGGRRDEAAFPPYLAGRDTGAASDCRSVCAHELDPG